MKHCKQAAQQSDSPVFVRFFCTWPAIVLVFVFKSLPEGSTRRESPPTPPEPGETRCCTTSLISCAGFSGSENNSTASLSDELKSVHTCRWSAVWDGELHFDFERHQCPAAMVTPCRRRLTRDSQEDGYLPRHGRTSVQLPLPARNLVHCGPLQANRKAAARKLTPLPILHWGRRKL